MDELWQRYRTFWTPVLIGLGAFLVGIIAVHILSDNPARAQDRMQQGDRRLKRMLMPDARKATVHKERGDALAADNVGWATRLNQTGEASQDVVDAAAEQALRAAILRGAEAQEASVPARLKSRFEDDEVAAHKALLRYERLRAQHVEALRGGDPNVAFSRLLSDTWNDLRVRANRADVELNAEQLGFGSIGSVSRATLPGRVLNLALVARICDAAIRHGVESIESVQVPANLEPGSPEDFLVLWPVDVVIVGDLAAVRHVLDLLTDPAHPVPLESSRIAQPRRSGAGTGIVELAVRASSVIVRPDVDLNLDSEVDE